MSNNTTEKVKEAKLVLYIVGIKDHQVFGIVNWIINKSGIENKSDFPHIQWAIAILNTYSSAVLKLPVETSLEVVADTVQRNFPHFVDWVFDNFKSINYESESKSYESKRDSWVDEPQDF